MIELKLLLTEEEAKVLENAMLNYAIRLDKIRKQEDTTALAHEAHTLTSVTEKYLEKVA